MPRLVRCLDCVTVEVIPDSLVRSGEPDPLLDAILAKHIGPLPPDVGERRARLNMPRLREIKQCEWHRQGRELPPEHRLPYSEQSRQAAHNPNMAAVMPVAACGCEIHLGDMHHAAADDWNHPNPDERERRRRQILFQMWGGHTGYPPEMYATKDTFRDDAVACYERHGRPGGLTSGPNACIDYQSDAKRLTDPRWKERNPDLPHVFLCSFCVTGDTEVVTRDGIVPIRQLAGRTADLLVPRNDPHGGLRSSTGRFLPVPVRMFGVQDVWAIRLKRGRSQHTVMATAEHRWVPTTGSEFVRTSDLKPGMSLRTLAMPRMSDDTMSAFAVAQGFVWGDGTRPQADRPATLTIYDNGKDKALLPFFAPCEPRWDAEREVWEVYGLPRSWKSLPDIRESRSFLVSWLAGYFAADGTVSERGQATLYSADKGSLEFARSVAAIAGIRTTPIHSKVRDGGFGAGPTALYSMGITSGTCPSWFFLIDEHRQRVADHAARSVLKRRADYHWQVIDVAPAGRQEVFCATVEDQEAFGLAHELMTGNCPYQSVVTTRIRQQRGDYDK